MFLVVSMVLVIFNGYKYTVYFNRLTMFHADLQSSYGVLPKWSHKHIVRFLQCIHLAFIWTVFSISLLITFSLWHKNSFVFVKWSYGLWGLLLHDLVCMQQKLHIKSVVQQNLLCLELFIRWLDKVEMHPNWNSTLKCRRHLRIQKTQTLTTYTTHFSSLYIWTLN